MLQGGAACFEAVLHSLVCLYTGMFVAACPDGFSRLVRGVLADATQEHCIQALLSLASAGSGFSSGSCAQHISQLMRQLCELAQAARQQELDVAAQALRACGEIAAAAVNACARLVSTAELVTLTHVLLKAVRQPAVGLIAAQGFVELLHSVSAWPVASRRQELGAALFEQAVWQLVPLAMYPTEDTSAAGDVDRLVADRFRAGSDGEGQELLEFRQQDLAELAATTLDLHGFGCDARPA